MGKEIIIIGKSSGAEYRLEKKIGEGGQGKVFSIKGGKLALKLLGKKTSKRSKLLQRKLSYLNTRPIESLPIAKPIEQIEGKWLGYVMELATDMVPLENLLKPEEGKDFTTWWIVTGGLKKRLLLLKNIAETLSKLHAKGLVYGDLSLTNIFVSEAKEYAEVFFIDPDTITHESRIGEAVYTLGYAAPELMQVENHLPTSGYDTYTDYYSFAIIAYQLLTLNHPFIGDTVNNGEPEMDEEAYLGKIPWVNHSTDKTNISNSGIPTEITISSKMMKAFQNTFEQGVKQPHCRTSFEKWKEILTGALHAVLECQNKSCQHHFFYSKQLLCPFCKEKQKFAGVISIYPLLKGLIEELKIKNKAIRSIGSIQGVRFITPNRYYPIYEDDFKSNGSDKEVCQIRFVEDAFFLKGLELKQITILYGKKMKTINIIDEVKISMKETIYLLADKDVNKYQQILKITLQK